MTYGGLQINCPRSSVIAGWSGNLLSSNPSGALCHVCEPPLRCCQSPSEVNRSCPNGHHTMSSPRFALARNQRRKPRLRASNASANSNITAERLHLVRNSSAASERRATLADTEPQRTAGVAPVGPSVGLIAALARRSVTPRILQGFAHGRLCDPPTLSPRRRFSCGPRCIVDGPGASELDLEDACVRAGRLRLRHAVKRQRTRGAPFVWTTHA